MCYYANFALRKNHAGIFINGAGELRSRYKDNQTYKSKYNQHIESCNLRFIAFDEIRFIKGQVMCWWVDRNAWLPCWEGPDAELRNQQLTDAYISYITEKSLLSP